MPKRRSQELQRQTHALNNAVFHEMYDSPSSLPGRYRWLTRDKDVRKIEELLDMSSETIGAPLFTIAVATRDLGLLGCMLFLVLNMPCIGKIAGMRQGIDHII